MKKLINKIKKLRDSLNKDNISFNITYTKLDGKNSYFLFEVNVWRDALYRRRFTIEKDKFLSSDEKEIEYLISQFFKDCEGSLKNI